jgi:hypothetical protein
VDDHRVADDQVADQDGDDAVDVLDLAVALGTDQGVPRQLAYTSPNSLAVCPDWTPTGTTVPSG